MYIEWSTEFYFTRSLTCTIDYVLIGSRAKKGYELEKSETLYFVKLRKFAE